jgi:ATP-dependent HslUV protease subunit HslV
MNESLKTPIRATTVVAVHYNGQLAIGADGQATLGHTVIKDNVKKIRKMANGSILAGFAGSTADAFTLLDRFEEKLSARTGNMYWAALALAKDWRTDRYLRRLEAVMVVADKSQILTIFGTGDVMKPDKGVVAIGSGGMYAHAAALALKKHAPHLSAKEIVEESLKIAADICIYTNHNRVIETIAAEKEESEEAKEKK